MALSNPKIEQACVQTLKYYDIFSYPLTASEIYRYLSSKSSAGELKASLDNLVRKRALYYNPNVGLYALQGHGINVKRRAQRESYSTTKIGIAQKFARILSKLPWIYGIGLSGSCSMMNAKRTDDIDVVIISAPRCMWFSRITAILIAKMLRIHRSKASTNYQDQICLNLFFDVTHLSVPDEKQNTYVAHEVLQMAPLFMRAGVYERFLYDNRWIKAFLPNAKLPSPDSKHNAGGGIFILLFPLEYIAKIFQLIIMSPVRGERITQGQLWFFPDDFERTLRRKIEID